MPAACASGKLLMVFFGSDGVEAVGWPAGWTELVQTSAAPTVAVGYKQSAGTEAGGTITVTTGGPEQSAHIAWCVDDAIAVATQAPESVAFVNQVASATSDPPSLTPTGGAKQYLFIAVSGSSNAAETISAYPTNYTGNNTRSAGPSGIASGSVAVASRELNAASDDPGTFTWSGSVDKNATTVAVHPAVAAATYIPQIIIVE